MFCLEIHHFWVQPGTMFFPFFSKYSAFKEHKVSIGYVLTQPGVSFSNFLCGNVGQKGRGVLVLGSSECLEKGEKKSQG